MTITSERTKTMHEIVEKDEAVREALAQHAQARQNRLDYARKVEEAHREYEREQQAAMDRGEPFSPKLEVIPDDAVKAHLNGRETVAHGEIAIRIGNAAQRLVPQMEAREQQLLDSVPKLKVAELQRVADEIGELAAAKSYLTGIRGLVRSHEVPDFTVVQPRQVSSSEVLEAALTGGSIIGRTPPPAPAQRVVDMSSPEGEALMGSNGGTNARYFP